MLKSVNTGDSPALYPEYLMQTEWYQAADNMTNLTDFLIQKVLKVYLCFVNAHIYKLHRHIMCTVHSFLILQHLSMTLDTIEETSTTVVVLCLPTYC